MRRTSRQLSEAERRDAWWFKEKFAQARCAVCGTHWIYPDVHHVVSQQELKQRGLPLWDVRNGLPICPIGSQWGNACHERHENASKRIPLSALSEENIDYAREVLGDFADDYLRRRYA